MGIVLRRSTTLCTWLRDFNRAARSMVSFMVYQGCLAAIPQFPQGASPHPLRGKGRQYNTSLWYKKRFPFSKALVLDPVKG
jgi:hypothetical protein